jgi:hypothetical protein
MFHINTSQEAHGISSESNKPNSLKVTQISCTAISSVNLPARYLRELSRPFKHDD